MSEIEIRVHEGPQAVGALVPMLAAEGLLPPPHFAMDPAYLAAGLEGDRPAILVAYRDSRAVGFMPIALRRMKFTYRLGPLTMGRLPYRQLRLLGCRCAASDERAVLDALLRYLTGSMRQRYDVASVSELPVHDALAKSLIDPPTWLRDHASIDPRQMDSYRVRIGGAFEGYLSSRMRGKTRSTLRRKLRTFDEAMPAPVTVRVYSSPHDVDEFLREASRVARHTYQARRGYEAVADTPHLRRQASYFAECGSLRSYILFADQEPCAYCYGFIYRRTYLYEVPGYDERIAARSPGTVLLYRMLEDLFGSGLVDELDFGAGAAEYKRMFATSNPSVLYANLFARRAYPRLLRGLERCCTWLSGAAKPLAARLRGEPRTSSAAAHEHSSRQQEDETTAATRD